MLGTLVLFSSQRTQKMLEKEHITEPLDNTKMLELFK